MLVHVNTLVIRAMLMTMCMAGGVGMAVVMMLMRVVVIRPMPMAVVMIMPMMVMMEPMLPARLARILAEDQGFDRHRHGVGRHADASEIDIIEVP